MDPRVTDLVKDLAAAKTFKDNAPTLEEVRAYLQTCFEGADQFTVPFYNAMKRNGWKGRDRRPIRNWKALAKRYASACWMEP